MTKITDAEELAFVSPATIAADLAQGRRDAGLPPLDSPANIRQLRDEGLTMQAIAVATGLTSAQVSTILFEPTWMALLPVFFAVLENGTDEGRQIAREELKRMARAADRYNENRPHKDTDQ